MKRSNSLYEKSLKTRKEVSASAFHFLFCEVVQYTLSKSSNDSQELEKKLEELGYRLGRRFLELVCFREKSSRKETSIISILTFIHTPLWRTLFNKTATEIEKSEEDEAEYMITENEPSLCNQFAYLPRGATHINCGAFVAGILEGLLNAAGFPSRVTAHFRNHPEGRSTVYLIKFAPEVLERESGKQK